MRNPCGERNTRCCITINTIVVHHPSMRHATSPPTASEVLRPRRELATTTFAAIDPARCTGCGWCLATCPDQLLAFEVQDQRKRTVLLSRERCDGCGHCAAKCPMGAITMRRKTRADTFPAAPSQAD